MMTGLHMDICSTLSHPFLPGSGLKAVAGETEGFVIEKGNNIDDDFDGCCFVKIFDAVFDDN